MISPFPSSVVRSSLAADMKTLRSSRGLSTRCPGAPVLFPELYFAYVVVGKLLDILSAYPARGSQLVSWQGCNNIDFVQLPTPILNHFDNRRTLCTQTVHCLLHIATSVVLAISSQDAGSDREAWIWAVGLVAGGLGELMHLGNISLRVHGYYLIIYVIFLLLFCTYCWSQTINHQSWGFSRRTRTTQLKTSALFRFSAAITPLDLSGPSSKSPSCLSPFAGSGKPQHLHCCSYLCNCEGPWNVHQLQRLKNGVFRILLARSSMAWSLCKS